MSTKTITLAGSEERAEFSGANAWLRNDGTDVIYAAAKPGITAGADGVVAILAGQSAPVYGANGAVWLLGTGSVQLIGSDYSTNPFKTSAQAGGSGADEVARAAINAHSGNAEIHVTAEEKAAWNSKAELTDIPDKLPADGGNADTVDGKHASDFPRMMGDIADCNSAMEYGTYNILPETKNAPTANYYHLVVEPAANGTWIKQTAVLSDATAPLINSFTRININGEWSEWTSSCVNADTLDGLHANEIASNPNLLINPDFKITQCRITLAVGGIDRVYFADRWHSVGCSVTNTDGVVSAAWDGSYIYDDGKNMGYIQSVSELPELIGKQVTLSIDIDGMRHHAVFTIPTTFPGIVREEISEDIDIAVGNYANIGIATLLFLKSTISHIIGDVKLELGSIATPFVPPDPATELAKCQRYYQIRSTGDIAAVDLRPSMATIKDIKLREDGNYEYIAEL